MLSCCHVREGEWWKAGGMEVRIVTCLEAAMFDANPCRIAYKDTQKPMRTTCIMYLYWMGFYNDNVIHIDIIST